MTTTSVLHGGWYVVVTLLGVGLLSLASVSEEQSADTTSNANNMLDVALKEAAENYRLRACVATEAYIRALESYQPEVLKSGNLDKAILVRDKITAAKTRLVKLKSSHRAGYATQADDTYYQKLGKVTWRAGKGGWGEMFRFDEAGIIYTTPGGKEIGKWALLDENHLVSITRDGICDQFFVDLKEGFLEVKPIGSPEVGQAAWSARVKR